jgi:DNA adenine methylase
MSAAVPKRAAASPGRTRPLLKWAGGKRQLLPELQRFVPARFGRYYEPFLGSGALFFHLWDTGALAAKRATLVDSNADLIGCYHAVARDVGGVIAHLTRLAAGHERDPHAHFYEVRDERFNPARAALVDQDVSAYPAELAAMFIYLNRTGFNGLYRLNSSGGFNVPAGRYARPRICDEANLRAVAAALRPPGVELRRASFDAVLESAAAGDFLYFDPPYVPLTATARFTAYTSDGFVEDDHRRLRRVLLELARRGCHLVMSNSTAALVRHLYADDPDARRAGLRAHVVEARRAINSDGRRRGVIPEYIVSTVAPAATRSGSARGRK